MIKDFVFRLTHKKKKSSRKITVDTYKFDVDNHNKKDGFFDDPEMTVELYLSEIEEGFHDAACRVEQSPAQREAKRLEKLNVDLETTGELYLPYLDSMNESSDDGEIVFNASEDTLELNLPRLKSMDAIKGLSEELLHEKKKEEVSLDKVQFSAIAPKNIMKGEYSMIDIYMYEDAFRSIIDEAIAHSEQPVQERKSGILTAKKHTMVKVVLTSKDIELEDACEEGIWEGDYLNFSFVIEVPQQYAKKQIFFIANVYFDDILVTRLKMIANCTSQLQQKLTITREDILSAFVSYAEKDRHRVAMIVQGMKKVRPNMNIFFDVDALRSGEDWEQILYKEIDQSDVLYLCWSQNAKQSEWVDKEWRYAYEQKGSEGIEPVPLDPPTKCPPPVELEKKHFNDRLLYLINQLK